MRLMTMAALLPLAACGNVFDDDPGIAPSGSGNVRTYQAVDFTTVRLAGSDDVDVQVGGGFSVRAEGDPAALDQLKITRDGAALNVSRRSGSSTGHVRVFVTMPAIGEAAIGGSGDMTVDRVRGGTFAARIAGSGSLALREVAAAVEVSIAGSGDVAARGTVQKLSVRIAGSGDLTAPELVAQQAEVRVFGSGDVQATVKGTADVRAAGSGDIDLGPAARCSVKKAGSGNVRCGG